MKLRRFFKIPFHIINSRQDLWHIGTYIKSNEFYIIILFEVVGVKFIELWSLHLKHVVSIKCKEHFAAKLNKVTISLEHKFELFINTNLFVTGKLKNLKNFDCIICILINNCFKFVDTCLKCWTIIGVEII